MSAGRKPVVLVVDDEADIRDILGLYISSMGCEILEAHDGAEGMEIVRKHHVDVVVSDLMMPRMSGLTFLETLRSEGFDHPFIFATAHPSRDSTVRALRLGAFDYIEKPFDKEDMQTVVSQAINVRMQSASADADLHVTVGDDSPAPRDGEKSEGKSGQSGNAQAEASILKLRSMRYSQPRPESSLPDERKRLIEMFVSEAQPQLIFCTSAIRSLYRSENRTWELGYLFRVMQALASAAVSVDADQIGALADAMQRCCTLLRVKPRSVTPEIIDLLERCCKALQHLVPQVGLEGNPKEEGAGFAFDDLLAELDRVTSSLENPELASA